MLKIQMSQGYKKAINDLKKTQDGDIYEAQTAIDDEWDDHQEPSAMDKPSGVQDWSHHFKNFLGDEEM